MDDVVYYLQNVLITSSGAWKLGGFGFAVAVDSNTGDMSNVQAFHYAVSETFDKILESIRFDLIYLPSHFLSNIYYKSFLFYSNQVVDFILLYANLIFYICFDG